MLTQKYFTPQKKANQKAKIPIDFKIDRLLYVR